MNELIKLDQAIVVHKILNEQCPEIRKQKLIKRSQISKYETRRANDLQVLRPRLEVTRKSFSYKGAKVWNDIPNNIRNAESPVFHRGQSKGLCYSTSSLMICYSLFNTRMYVIMSMILQSIPAVRTLII